MRLGGSANLAFEHHASSLHQLLHGGLPGEEGSYGDGVGLSSAHLRHALLADFFSYSGNTNLLGLAGPRHAAAD